MLPINPKIKLIGRREFVDFPLLEINKVEAKIDTGAYTCAIHCNNIVLKTEEGKQILTFQLLDDRVYQFKKFFWRNGGALYYQNVNSDRSQKNKNYHFIK